MQADACGKVRGTHFYASHRHPSPGRHVRILLIEDDPVDADLFLEALQATRGADSTVVHKQCLADGMHVLRAEGSDVVILDLSLPDSFGLQGLDRLLVQEPTAAVVVLTGRKDDQIAVEALRRGAQDYFIKGEPTPELLWRSLRYAVERRRVATASGPASVATLEREARLLETEHAVMREMRLRRDTGGLPILRTGTLLANRYRIGTRLGAGASSEVFEVFDEKMGRPACVKFVRVGLSEVESQALAREARLTSSMDHPNVLKVHELGVIEGAPYLLMELAAGGDVGRMLADGPLPPERARAIMLDVLAGLAYIHCQGVFHQDLKPANILIAADGRALIADFGIAFPAAGRDAHETQTSLGGPGIAGTPAYVSPETLLGQSPSARSDIYSAGAVLYHLLAGRPYISLDGMTIPAMRRAIRESRPSPQAPGGAILAVALRALEKDPAKRYADPDEMRRSLET